MKTILSKKVLFLLLLLFNTVMIGILFIVPLSNKVMEYVQLYTRAFVEPFPEMKIVSGKIEFLDPVPVKLIIGDSVEIICDTLYDEDYFAGCPKNSVFISEDNIYLKNEKGIKQIDMSSLNIQDSEKKIVPAEIRSFLEKYAKIILRLSSIVFLLLLYLLLITIAIFGAGIGFMVDAFMSGKFNFIQLLNLSSIFLSVFLVLNYFLYIWDVLTVKFLFIHIVLFYLFIGCFVYLLSKISHFSLSNR
ncbi:DUF1189 family protein [candidate division KSB1 bacterium]|nr:DUF1189 family protein [candidate division KSB1 bacterium]